jgi:hypothetical protein
LLPTPAVAYLFLVRPAIESQAKRGKFVVRDPKTRHKL